MKQEETPSWLDPFFRQRRVAVLAIARGNRSPLTSPVWYDYDGKAFYVQVEASSAKAKAIARAGSAAVSLTIQSEVPPYRYAVVHGKATIKPSDRPGLRQRLARRYFGGIVGDMYVAEEEKKGVAEASLQLIEILPERTNCHDFGPDAGITGRIYFAIYRWLKPVPA